MTSHYYLTSNFTAITEGTSRSIGTFHFFHSFLDWFWVVFIAFLFAGSWILGDRGLVLLGGLEKEPKHLGVVDVFFVDVLG